MGVDAREDARVPQFTHSNSHMLTGPGLSMCEVAQPPGAANTTCPCAGAPKHTDCRETAHQLLYQSGAQTVSTTQRKQVLGGLGLSSTCPGLCCSPKHLAPRPRPHLSTTWLKLSPGTSRVRPTANHTIAAIYLKLLHRSSLLVPLRASRAWLRNRTAARPCSTTS